MPGDTKKLAITGAKENNLKSVSLEIPHDAFTIVTGLSGSGKSSLAFGTVFAEGQRRYIETFSPYTRQFFDKVKKPDAEKIDHVRPAIAIQQRTRVTNSRSTVGSMTDINDYLKVIWTNTATPVCPACETELRAYSPGELVEWICKRHELRPDLNLLLGATIHFRAQQRAAPAPKGRGKRRAIQSPLPDPGPMAELVSATVRELSALGFNRAFDPATREIHHFDDGFIPPLDEQRQIFLVLDRIKAGAAAPDRKRLQDSVDQAYHLVHQKLPDGASADEGCVLIELGGKELRPLSLVYRSPGQPNARLSSFAAKRFGPVFRCPAGNFTAARPKNSLFSFNHPAGACPECKGFGKVLAVDPKLCVPNPSLTIKQHALACWAGKAAAAERRELARFCEANGISTSTPWKDLPEEVRAIIFNHKSKDFWGVNHWFRWLERKAYKMHVRVFLSRYRSQIDCPECGGTRLKKEALAFRVAGKTLPDLWNMPVGNLLKWLERLRDDRRAHGQLPRALAEVFSASIARLRYLVELGLPYLSLERQARTLSGGETQRVNLATALGSELISTQFVLDEPSVGLHPRDTERLIGAMRALTDRGNSLLVVEHDLDCIASADHIVEIGPESGEHGGEIVFNGRYQQWKPFPIALPPLVTARRKPTHELRVRNATRRNLKGIDLSIPLGGFVCLTGASGSGKSTLANEVIRRAFEERAVGVDNLTGQNIVEGFEHLSQVLLVDQSPLARSPRANIATYSGIWDTVRAVLERSEEAQARALPRSAFSFNVDGGRCPECKGAGFIREDMQFLSDVFIPCEICLGKRFQPLVLEVSYRGKNVDDILRTSLRGCLDLFSEHEGIVDTCRLLDRLGLGHLTLGHPLSELSGGEAQRLKLVPFIQQSGKGNSLLIFDEPTTGLHLRDIERLISVFRLLCDRGHSILCIEHNLSLIASCDWIIDLGPEGGEEGGRVLLTGTPGSFISGEPAASSYTARFLTDYAASVEAKAVFKRSRDNRPAVLRKQDVKALEIRGAREHNLKDVTVTMPLGSFVALTGVSGSGKSTIAKDIIYAEGQRRYLDCLSPYARQYIKELHKPEIDELLNITPTICVYQHTFQPSRLSTVGTMSEIYNFLRLLFAKAGVQFCPDHPEHQITPLSARSIAEEIQAFRAKSVRVLAPIVKMKKGHHRAVFERAIASEITQLRVDGVFVSPATVNTSGGLQKTKAHTIEFVLGRFNPSQVELALIEDVVQQGLALGGGTLIVLTDGGETVYSTERTCPVCKRGFFKPDPEDLSFHSRRGACERCMGTGSTAKGEICPSCCGARINPIGRNLRIGGQSIFEACSRTPRGLIEFFEAVSFDSRRREIAEPVLREVFAKAETLIAVGLEELDLNRDCTQLSGGELQRLRLATAMGSTLSGVIYIFDEPSVGLHPLDNRKVLSRLATLKERGNSVIMIEHDTESILAADHVIDIGPGGGKDGGSIVYNGALGDFLSHPSSATASALRGDLFEAERPKAPANGCPAGTLQIQAGSSNNIDNLSATLPLGCLLSVAGVSGAGKSSLVHGIIAETISGKGKSWTSASGKVKSSLEITRLLEIDQKPIGINSRSTPASYLKIWDEVRKLFASSIEAKTRGWTQSFFSYNAGKGRCPDCKGLGFIKLEMSFLPDAEVVCETCGGARYTEDADSIHYLGHSVSEILSLTFEEARSLFANHRRIHRTLHLACELGLGYLTLGQSSTTLSGGESQRIKLVSELNLHRAGHTLYILDEPTTGLHKSDVLRLLRTLRELVSRGNTVIMIEHDPDVLRFSDHIVELGPGPGERGGKIIFEGTPAELKGADTPWGTVLREGRDRRAAAARQRLAAG